jgi:tRNA-specific 2-thiouridylase
MGGLSAGMLKRLPEQFELQKLSAKNTQGNRDDIWGCVTDAVARETYVEKYVFDSVRIAGLIKTTDGKPMGEHHGLYKFHIGQKNDIPLRHVDQETKEKFVVVRFNSREYTLIIGSEQDLVSRTLRASNANWMQRGVLEDGLKGVRCTAKIASLTSYENLNCVVTLFEGGNIHVLFESAIKAVIPGQPIVFYDGDDVLGGAYVDSK